MSTLRRTRFRYSGTESRLDTQRRRKRFRTCPQVERLEHRLLLAGDLDLGFGDGGLLTSDFEGPSRDDGRVVLVQADGKVVVVGSSEDEWENRFALARYAADGSLDASFGVGGRVTTSIDGVVEMAYDAALCASGQIVVVGSGNGARDMVVVRYNSDGSLDTSFGTDGLVITDVLNASYTDAAHAVAFDGDGKIVVAGKTGAYGNRDFALVRYNTDGTLDGSFGTGGQVTTDLGSTDDLVEDLLIDGTTIVLVGHSQVLYDTSTADFVIARYTSNGSLDPTFDGDGLVTTDFGSTTDRAYAVTLDAAGQLVVAGLTNGDSSDRGLYGLARYNSDGSLDTSLDVDGLVTVSAGVFSRGARDVAVDGADKIVLTGSGQAQRGFAAVRLNDDGSLDTTWDGDGLVVTDFGSNPDNAAWSLALTTDGKVVVAGTTTISGYCGSCTDRDFGVARYNNDGSLDTTWDGDGLVNTDFVSVQENVAEAVLTQPDGKMIAVGHLNRGTAPSLLMRYNADGSLDSTFGDAGQVTSDVEFARGGVLDSQGRIVIAGSRTIGSPDFALARYNSDGSPDSTFGTSGLVVSAFSSGIDRAVDVAIDSSGRLVVAGLADNSSSGTGYDFVVARYEPDGSLDTSFGVAGHTSIHFNSYEEATSLALDGTGRILVAGFTRVGSYDQFAIARWTSAGSLDTSFDGDGKVTTSLTGFGDQAHAIVVDASQRIVAAGSASNFSLGTSLDLALARYNDDGSLDTSFDGDGKVLRDSGSGGLDEGRDLVIADDGQIVVVGRDNSKGSVVRFNPDGSPDATFGTAGEVTTVFSGYGETIFNGVALDGQGKIVAAGVAQNHFTNGKVDFALARLHVQGDDVDIDGVSDEVENEAPNGGDGNNDGVLDSQQGNVASLRNSLDAGFVTLASPTGTVLVGVRAQGSPSPSDQPAGVQFSIGYLEFKVENLAVGGATTVTLFTPPGTSFTTYYKYSPTPDNSTPHWYEFLYDSTGCAADPGDAVACTGAEIAGNVITLHLVDGQRGDADLSANGIIQDPARRHWLPINLPWHSTTRPGK